MRQDHVKEDILRANDQRSPIKRTFAEAKQTMNEYEEAVGGQTYNEVIYAEELFLEADEDASYEQEEYLLKNYSSSDSKVRYDEGELQLPPMPQPVRSAECFVGNTMPEYNQSMMRKDRPRRRRSREFGENDMITTSNEDEPRRKPETMRSISEDTPTRTVKQPVTRRTLSHPEKETHSQV